MWKDFSNKRLKRTCARVQPCIRTEERKPKNTEGLEYPMGNDKLHEWKGGREEGRESGWGGQAGMWENMNEDIS